jgi:hypothetical protein
MYFRQKSGRNVTLLTPPLRSVLLLLQTTPGWEKSGRVWSTVRCGASHYTDQFLVPGCGE